MERPYLDPPMEEQEAWFLPMGYRLRVVTNCDAILRAARRAYGGFGTTTAGEGNADLTLRLYRHPIDDGTLGDPLFRSDPSSGLVYQTTGRDSTLVMDVQRGEGMAYVSPTTLGNEAFFRWHYLDFALFYLIEAHGFVGVHGAAVAREGRAVLLRADGGQGKTTLTFAAARRRFQALAEDVVWIAPDHQRWWGTPWTFHLLPDATGLFPELAERPATVQINGEQKIAVCLESLRPGSTTVSAAPAAVVLLRREEGGKSRLESLDPDAAWREWLRGCSSREREHVPDYDRRIQKILRHPTYRLHFGDDIERAVDLLEPLFD